jgi:hypothetical protein
MPFQPGLYIRDDVNYNYSTRFNDQNGKKVSVSAGALGSHPIKFYSSNVANVGAVAFVPEVTIPIMNATFGTTLYGSTPYRAPKLNSQSWVRRMAVVRRGAVWATDNSTCVPAMVF